jgi:thymidine kinase
MGSLHTIHGPMSSGKSTFMVLLLKKLVLSRKQCVMFKHKKDNREHDKSNMDYLSTKDGMTLPIDTYKISNIDELLYHPILSDTNSVNSGTRKVDVIAIDEGHFFPNIVKVCEQLIERGYHVIVTALLNDFERKLFLHIAELISTSDEVTTLSGVCDNCGATAHWSARLKCKIDDLRSSKIIETDSPSQLRIKDKGPRLVVGDKDLYRTTCRKCHEIVSNMEVTN